MNKRKLYVGILIFIILIGIFVILSGTIQDRMTARVAGDTYLEDLETYYCEKTGFWDEENADYKLTMCPDDQPIMTGVGINVKNDDQAGGRARCCRGRNMGVPYDCVEAGRWEKTSEDYKITRCPGDRPILTGIGVKVDNDNQAGGKAYCCKVDNLELYSCAITNYWSDSNEDNELTVCPDDRPILAGAGFKVSGDHQAGGRVRCCKGQLKLSEEEETPEPEEDEDEDDEEEEEPKAKSLKSILVKLICK